MARRYADTVEVRPAGAEADGAPSTFLWRGRLYVVREVLGHWRERRAWWTAPAARALHGESVGDAPSGGEERPDPTADRAAALGQEHEVWRVEASPGRAFAVGVYDLCRDLSGAVAGGAWRLSRVAD